MLPASIFLLSASVLISGLMVANEIKASSKSLGNVAQKSGPPQRGSERVSIEGASLGNPLRVEAVIVNSLPVQIEQGQISAHVTGEVCSGR
jgi:hypothetical protein